MSRVAVITRTKDRPTFLKRAIKSVAAQTYDEYIHVIINDGGSQKIVEDIIGEFGEAVTKHIKVFHRETASNAPDTIFNESIRRVQSEFVVIHDDDDSWHPEFLQRTTNHLLHTDTPSVRGVVVRTDKVIERVLDNGRIKNIDRKRWMPHIRAIGLYRQCAENQLTPIAFLYRRDAYDEIGGYDDKLPVLGDWDFGIRFLQKYDIDYIDPGHALAYYHHRKYKENAEGNTSYAGNDKARYYTNLLMNKYLRQELGKGNLGVGYIMSKTRYNEDHIATLVRRALPKFVTNRLEKRVKN
jgi:glycosyltransferase involved in cell wall biosynthesis